MVKDCKMYKCDICGAEEIVVDEFGPIDTITFEIYGLKPCICKRCLRLAIEANGLVLNDDGVTSVKKEE